MLRERNKVFFRDEVTERLHMFHRWSYTSILHYLSLNGFSGVLRWTNKAYEIGRESGTVHRGGTGGEEMIDGFD